MFTRTFERENEVINISEYGFEWWINHKLEKTGLVENLEDTIELLINDGWTEVI